MRRRGSSWKRAVGLSAAKSRVSRQIGTNHHITLTAEQIKSLSDAEEPGSQLA